MEPLMDSEILHRIGDPTELFVAETVWLLIANGVCPTVAAVRAELMEDEGLSEAEAQERINEAIERGDARCAFWWLKREFDPETVLSIDDEMERWLTQRYRFGTKFIGHDEQTSLSHAFVAQYVRGLNEIWGDGDPPDLVNLAIHIAHATDPPLDRQVILEWIFSAVLHGAISVPVLVEDEL